MKRFKFLAHFLLLGTTPSLISHPGNRFQSSSHVDERTKKEVFQKVNGKTLDKFGKEVSRDFPEAHVFFRIICLLRRIKMSLSKSDRIYILSQYLKTISHISNPEYQNRVWVLRKGPECQAFDDLVCDFFDEADGILEEHKDFGITEYQYGVLKNFRERFEEFCDQNDYPEEFIDTIEWKNITNMAKEVLRTFKYEKKRD